MQDIEIQLQGLRVQIVMQRAYREWVTSLPAGRRRNKGDHVVIWTAPATDAVIAAIARKLRKTDYLDISVDAEFKDRWRAVRERYPTARDIKLLAGDALPPIPITRFDPWAHQVSAFHFGSLLPAALLAAECGGGKTKIAIDLITNLHLKYTLIIAPKKAVRHVWPPEIEKHVIKEQVGVLCIPLHGPIKKRVQTADEIWEAFVNLKPLRNAPDYDHLVFVTNYEAIWREPLASWLLKRTWHAVFLDESHRIKSAGSRVSRFMARMTYCAIRRYAMTGTPLPETPLDVYGQYRFLDPGIYGTNYSTFKEQYVRYGGYMNMEVVGYKNQKRLQRKLHRIAIFADDISKTLPRLVEIPRYLKLEKEAKRHYRELDKKLTTDIRGGTITVNNALTKILRLQEIVGGTATITYDGNNRRRESISSAKLAFLYEILEDLPIDEPVVIFAVFKREMQRIKETIQALQRDVLMLTGNVDELSEWKAGKAPILVAQIQAGKEAIDLTRAAYGVFYSQPLSLGDYHQATRRLHRPGQTRPVRLIHLLAESVDAQIRDGHEKKRHIVKHVIASRR